MSRNEEVIATIQLLPCFSFPFKGKAFAVVLP
jgi:hypothetical protein